MSEMNTARPRIPSPFETAGISFRPCAPRLTVVPFVRKLVVKVWLALLAATTSAVVELTAAAPLCVND